MSENRYQNLREALVRRGVAVRYAKRAVLEIESHHRDLLEEARARGESPEEARRSADAAMGSADTLIERYASRNELRSWSNRFPAGYGFAPILCFGGLGFALMYATWATLHAIWPHPRHVHVSAALIRDINVGMIALFLWVLPISVAMGFGLLAHQQRMSLRWPVAGILLLCLLTALINVGFGVRGGPATLFLQAGIGIGTKRVPEELARALGKAIAAFIPMAWLRWRVASRPPSLS